MIQKETEFKENIKQYNNSLAMACMKATVELPEGPGSYSYRIHKQVYHLIGSLHPNPPMSRSFAQIFILDTAHGAAELAGKEVNSSCSFEMFQKLIGILKVGLGEKERARLEGRAERKVTMTFRLRSEGELRRYQNPTADEIAAVYVGDEEEIPDRRGSTTQKNNGQLQNTHVIDPNRDPMSYSLLFPNGYQGRHINIPYARNKGNRQ